MRAGKVQGVTKKRLVSPGAFQIVRLDTVKKGQGGAIAMVEPGSLGARSGLRSGDRLLAINDHALRDIIDVQYYGAEEMLDLLLERSGQQSFSPL